MIDATIEGPRKIASIGDSMQIPQPVFDFADLPWAVFMGGTLGLIGAKAGPNRFYWRAYGYFGSSMACGFVLGRAWARGAGEADSAANMGWAIVGVVIGMAPGTVLALIPAVRRFLWPEKP